MRRHLRSALEVAILEVRGDAKERRPLVGKEVQDLAVGHGPKSCRRHQGLTLGTDGAEGVHSFDMNVADGAGELTCCVDVHARKEQAARDAAIEDGVRAFAAVAFDKLTRRLQHYRKRYPTLPGRRNDGRKVGDGEMPELVEQEIDGQTVGAVRPIIQAMMKQLRIEERLFVNSCG